MSDLPRPADAAGAPRPKNPLTWLLLGLVRTYQLVVSPWFPQRCKYYPSCSAYAVTALRTHGAVRGTGLAVWRVLRCNPWSLGGVDYVPPRSGTPPADPPPADPPPADVRSPQDAPKASAEL